MLDKILGSKTAQTVFLVLVKYKKVYATMISKDQEIPLSGVQRQLERFADAGILVSTMIGNTRIYEFNPKSRMAEIFKTLVEEEFKSLSFEDTAKLLKRRQRPRKKGKEVDSGNAKYKKTGK